MMMRAPSQHLRIVGIAAHIPSNLFGFLIKLFGDFWGFGYLIFNLHWWSGGSGFLCDRIHGFPVSFLRIVFGYRGVFFDLLCHFECCKRSNWWSRGTKLIKNIPLFGFHFGFFLLFSLCYFLFGSSRLSEGIVVFPCRTIASSLGLQNGFDWGRFRLGIAFGLFCRWQFFSLRFHVFFFHDLLGRGGTLWVGWTCNCDSWKPTYWFLTFFSVIRRWQVFTKSVKKSPKWILHSTVWKTSLTLWVFFLGVIS